MVGVATLMMLIFGTCQAEACARKRFKVTSYGTTPEAISRLVTDVNKNKGGRIIFPKEEAIVLPIVDDPSSGHRLLPQAASVVFFFNNCKYLDVDLNGSTIILEQNNSTKYALFLFRNCKSFSIRNGKIVGDARKHDYSTVLYNTAVEESTHEWGHGVMVIGSKGKIDGLNISNMTGDGIYVASQRKGKKTYEARIEIQNTEISYCRRNGITYASTMGFSLVNTSIHDIGSFEMINGTDPRAGIDFEYEDGVGCLGDVVISNCSIVSLL